MNRRGFLCWRLGLGEDAELPPQTVAFLESNSALSDADFIREGRADPWITAFRDAQMMEVQKKVLDHMRRSVFGESKNSNL